MKIDIDKVASDMYIDWIITDAMPGWKVKDVVPLNQRDPETRSIWVRRAQVAVASVMEQLDLPNKKVDEEVKFCSFEDCPQRFIGTHSHSTLA